MVDIGYQLSRLTAPFRRAFAAQKPVSIDMGCTCVFCGAEIPRSKYGFCPSCDSRPRVRSIVPLMREVITPALQGKDVLQNPAMAFAAVPVEKKLIGECFPELTSVSLFGNYGKPHQSGVDARDLSAFASESFSGHYSCLLFDYFTEHEKALAEAYRVLAPGGVFFTHIQHPRLTEEDMPPRELSIIKPKEGYYEYIPSDQQMQNVRVGAPWFLGAMKRVGFDPRRYRIADSSGIGCDWFVGWK